MPAKVGPALVVTLILLLAPATAAPDDFVGFEARYIPHVEYDGKLVETDGSLTIEFKQLCDSLYYSWNHSETRTWPDRVQENHNSGVWHEKLDGTSGTSHYFVQEVERVDGQPVSAYVVNWLGSFDRAAALWEGSAELIKQWRDIEVIHKLPLPEGVLTPALAYKSMFERLAAGETSFVHPVSVIGMIDSLDPGYNTYAPVTVEIVPSPFEGLALPQTPDGLFGGKFWVARISNPSAYAHDGVKTLTYQLFENGLRGYILSETEHFRLLYEPVTAHAVAPEPC